jgi:hypothetical protein
VNLEAIALMRAQEQYESGAWKGSDRDDAVEVLPPDPAGVVPLQNGEAAAPGRVCFRCGKKALSTRNTSNLCRECHFSIGKWRRRMYREARSPECVPVDASCVEVGR